MIGPGAEMLNYGQSDLGLSDMCMFAASNPTNTQDEHYDQEAHQHHG
jgi:hypothetical protein